MLLVGQEAQPAEAYLERDWSWSLTRLKACRRLV